MSGVVELLQSIVRIPSISGAEEDVRDHLVRWLCRHGVPAEAQGRNVVAVLEGPVASDRGLLLLTHIDVVPVGSGWTRDPWDGALEAGSVHGRGANDAKASAAAMAWVAAHADRRSWRGRLVVVLACDEETGGEEIEAIRDDLPAYTAAGVGEPTELDVCPGQRGLLRASLLVTGRSCHASRPWEGESALLKAARDVLAVEDLDLGESDALLGPPTLQATVIAGGTRYNVIPGACTVELDGRPTPHCDTDIMLSHLRRAVSGEVVVRSRRYEPVRTSRNAEIVRLALEASPTRRVRGFQGVSDLFHVRAVDGVVMGPGTSAASHAPDEWVSVSQLEEAVVAYAQIVDSYLGGS